MQGIISNNLPTFSPAVYHDPLAEQQDIDKFTTDNDFDTFLQNVTQAGTPEPVSALFVDDFKKDLPQALALCQIALHPAGRVYLEHKGLQEKSDNCSRLLLDKLKPDMRREMLQHPVLLATGHLALTLPTDSSRPDFTLPLPPVCFEERQGTLTPAEVDSMWKVLQHRSRPASDKREADAFHHMASIYQQAEQPDIAIWIKQQANSLATPNQTNSLATLNKLAVNHIASYLQEDSPVQTVNNLIALAVNKHLKAVVQPDMDAAKVSLVSFRLQKLQQIPDKIRIAPASFTAVLDGIRNLRADKRAPLLGDLAQLINRLPDNQQQAEFDNVLTAILALSPEHRANPLLQLTKLTKESWLSDKQKQTVFVAILNIVTVLQSQEQQAVLLITLLKLIRKPWLSDEQKQTAFDTILKATLALPPQKNWSVFCDNLLILTQEPWLADKQKQAIFYAVLKIGSLLPSHKDQADLLEALIRSADLLGVDQRLEIFHAILQATLALSSQEYQAALLEEMINPISQLDIDQRQELFHAILKATQTLPPAYQVTLLKKIEDIIKTLPTDQQQIAKESVKKAISDLSPGFKEKIRIRETDNE